MAISIPSSYTPIVLTDLLTRIAGAKGQDHIHTMLSNTNWLYANHAPPLLAASCYCDNTGRTHTLYTAIPNPSADGLTYEALYCTWRSATGANTVDITLSYSTTNSNTGATWTSLTTDSSLASGTDADQRWTSSGFTLPATARYLRIEVTTGVANTCQLQHILVRPKVITSIASGWKSSGFRPYDSALFETSAAPIDTQHLNQVYRNASVVANDRAWCLYGYIWARTPVPATVTRMSSGPEIQQFLASPCYFPGGDGKTVTFKARAGTSTGTTHQLLAGTRTQPASALLACDDTDNSATVTASSTIPTFTADIKWGSAVGAIEFEYLLAEYTPSYATADVLVGPTPPAQTADIAMLNAHVEAIATRYPCPGTQMDSAQAGGTGWHIHVQLPIGVYSGQVLAMVAYDPDSSGSPTQLDIQSDASGGSGLSAIVIQHASTSNALLPPWEVTAGSSAPDISYRQGSQYWDDSPGSAVDRLLVWNGATSLSAPAADHIQLDEVHGFAAKMTTEKPLA